MRKLLSACAALALAASPALADFSYTQGSGTTVKAGTLSGGVLPWMNLVDGSGVAFGTVTNPWILGYSVAASPTVAPGTVYGLDMDCNAASTLCQILQAGTAAVGSPYSSSGQAVVIAGYDGTNPQFMSTDGNGQVILGPQSAAKGGDPCENATKTNSPFSSASGTFAIVTGVSAKKIYVCSITAVVPSAVAFSLAEGSSATCGTSAQAAVMGVATSGTASQGMSFAANGGLALGNGSSTVASTATNANYLCIFQSGTAQIAGNVSYVQQ